MNTILARIVKPSPYVFPGINMLITKERIEHAACRVWNLSPTDLKEITRRRPIVEARSCVMIARHKLLDESLAAAGSPYGKDHATVLHHKRTLPFSIRTDSAFRKRYNQFLSLLNVESL